MDGWIKNWNDITTENNEPDNSKNIGIDFCYGSFSECLNYCFAGTCYSDGCCYYVRKAFLESEN